ncbi:hypothetical protein ACPCHT_36440 [Nucisporomicrobium flavum]|uniref:hypothetical protein n=1 Tax=Micromonosporaceae TaxID=28056 RepID=UPI0018F2D019|nr:MULTISPECIES: hypothetical protein [Micromonosporaceae]UQU65087.1 hypothetical protein COUCH_01650 [Couchioplanes caeruleus]
MPHSGDELGADLVDLWEAGQYELKPVAGQIREAAGALLLADNSGYNWYRDGKLGGPYGPAKPAWESLRDDFFEILRTTAENLDLTGDAMVLAADEYASTDSVAGKKFEELKPAVEAAHAQDGVPQ